MTFLKSMIVVSAVALLVACGNSPQQKKDIADARYTEEKTKTMQDYKKCLDKAGKDTAKMDACERLIRPLQPATPAAAPVPAS